MQNTTNSNNFTTKSVNNTPYLPQPCLFYFVRLAADLSPIPSTMFSKPNNALDANATPCTDARLTSTQMKPPAGHVQCFFKSGFRYFYLVNSHTTGQPMIVPDSMIQVSNNGKPQHMCVGTSSYLEYINFVPQPQITD